MTTETIETPDATPASNPEAGAAEHQAADSAPNVDAGDAPVSAAEFAGLQLTDVAAAKVVEIRDSEDIEPDFRLRVKVQGGGCAGFQYDLFFDQAAEGDTRFESNGVELICDQMSFMYLMGTQIDYVEGLQGAGFKFENPNSTGSCGCGSSFSV